MPRSRDLGRLSELSAVADGRIPGPDARWCARAIQYLRSHAQELKIDPGRIAASGSSAGAGIALWVAFHDNLADPDSPDPVARQSSRLSCVGVDGAQTSYDPRFIKALIGGRAHEHPALPMFYGLTADADADSPRMHKLYEEASPINHVSCCDPPVILFYAEPKGPLPADAKRGQGIHHPRFGEALKAQLDPLKIECILHHSSEYPKDTDPIDGMCRDMTEFFVKKLRAGRCGKTSRGHQPQGTSKPGSKADLPGPLIITSGVTGAPTRSGGVQIPVRSWNPRGRSGV